VADADRAQADGGVIAADGNGGWIKDVGVVIHAPSNAPIAIAHLDVCHIHDLFPILPEGRFFFSSRRRHTRWPRDWSSDGVLFRSGVVLSVTTRRRFSRAITTPGPMT